MSEEPMIVTQPQYVRLGAVLIALETSKSLREATRAIHDLKTESFPEIARLRALLAEARADYEALRRETDGGSESMTHDDAIAEIRGLRAEVECKHVTLDADSEGLLLCGHLDDSPLRPFLTRLAEENERLTRERDEAKGALCRRDIERGQEAQEFIDFADARGLPEEECSWDGLRRLWAAMESRAEKAEARVAELECGLSAIVSLISTAAAGTPEAEAHRIGSALLSPKPAPLPDLTFDADDPLPDMTPAPCGTCGGTGWADGWNDTKFRCPDCRKESAK